MAVADSTGRDLVMGVGEKPGSDVTARLLLAHTALYAEQGRHSPDEQQQYAQIALRLIEGVDEATRATAMALLRRSDAPESVLERLAARRASVEARAELWSKQALPAPDGLGEAFFAASGPDRRRLLSLIKDDKGADKDVPTAALDPQDAERPFAALNTAAMEGRIGEFIREFERLVEVPKALCERILNDPSGEPMVIVAKAVNMPAAVLQRILLLVNPAVSHSIKRVYDLTDLFHQITRRQARTLLWLWHAQVAPNAATARAEAVDRRPPREFVALGLRARFSALAERVGGLSARPYPGNVGRRDLRSR